MAQDGERWARSRSREVRAVSPANTIFVPPCLSKERLGQIEPSCLPRIGRMEKTFRNASLNQVPNVMGNIHGPCRLTLLVIHHIEGLSRQAGAKDRFGKARPVLTV